MSEGLVVNARAMPPMTWNGTLVGADETVTHYLHLSVFPCEQCNGPVVSGLLGTRRNEISQETDIRKVGAACIACGFRPVLMIEPSVGHHFRPVEWKWALKEQAESPVSVVDAFSAELSLNADVD